MRGFEPEQHRSSLLRLRAKNGGPISWLKHAARCLSNCALNDQAHFVTRKRLPCNGDFVMNRPRR